MIPIIAIVLWNSKFNTLYLNTTCLFISFHAKHCISRNKLIYVPQTAEDRHPSPETQSELAAQASAAAKRKVFN